MTPTKASSELSGSVRFSKLTVSSPAFADGAMLPARYTCDGEDLSPPLDLGGLPKETKTLAIIMTGTYDGKEEWAHWLAWNIPPISHIVENRKSKMEGLNYFSRHGYEGPCPAGGIHNYEFKIYAVDTALELPSAVTKTELEKAISDHILGFGSISCFYHRPLSGTGQPNHFRENPDNPIE